MIELMLEPDTRTRPVRHRKYSRRYEVEIHGLAQDSPVGAMLSQSGVVASAVSRLGDGHLVSTDQVHPDA